MLVWVVIQAKRVLSVNIITWIDYSYDRCGIMQFSLGIVGGFAAIRSAGMAKKGAGARQNDSKPAIKDSLIAIKESLIVRRRSGEIVALGRFRCDYWIVWVLI